MTKEEKRVAVGFWYGVGLTGLFIHFTGPWSPWLFGALLVTAGCASICVEGGK